MLGFIPESLDGLHAALLASLEELFNASQGFRTRVVLVDCNSTLLCFS